MGLVKLNPDSYGGGSPAVWRRDASTLLVQGWSTDAPGIEPPAGEDIVTLPALLAVDAVSALDGDTVTFVDLMRMLRTFAATAFRLETRQSYATADEAHAFAAWQQRGCVPDRGDPLIAQWTGLVRARCADGAVVRRAHVVHYPLSDYVRFELVLQQAHSLPAGEQVRVIDAARRSDLAATEDFWLFDDRVGVRLIYDDAGQLIRLERMTTAAVDRARAIRDSAWAAGTDLAGLDTVVPV